MMVQLSGTIWANTDHIETVWEEWIDDDTKIVRVCMTSGDEFGLDKGLSLQEAASRIQMAMNPPPSYPPHGQMPEIPTPGAWPPGGYKPAPR